MCMVRETGVVEMGGRRERTATGAPLLDVERGSARWLVGFAICSSTEVRFKVCSIKVELSPSLTVTGVYLRMNECRSR